MINIADLDKAEVLAELYNNSKVQGMGFMGQRALGDRAGKPMTIEWAKGIIKDQGLDFDYLHGKVMKVHLSGNEFDPYLYDRDVGSGAAKKVVDSIRARASNKDAKQDIRESEQQSKILEKPSLFSKTSGEPVVSLVKLKNGSEIPKPIVITTMMSLEAIMNSNPIAFYELVEKARDSKHVMFGNTKEVVSKWALMDSNGTIHSSVKDIVLSAVSGNELEMSLGNPIASAENNIKNRDEKITAPRTVSKAFLIKGGTPEERQEKYNDLISDDQFLMYSNYEGENELAVIFSAKHSDFDGMTFQEAKKLAGGSILSSDFHTSTFDREPRFGIIDISNLTQSFKFR
jgi:hypothetical protein